MAGGVKKPVNIFRLKNLGLPKEVFNWRLWFSVFSFGLLGAARVSPVLLLRRIPDRAHHFGIRIK